MVQQTALFFSFQTDRKQRGLKRAVWRGENKTKKQNKNEHVEHVGHSREKKVGHPDLATRYGFRVSRRLKTDAE